jgi:xanthine/uracil permease
MSYKQTALSKGMVYTVSDVPPPLTGAILGFQHFMTMLGATALSTCRF